MPTFRHDFQDVATFRLQTALAWSLGPELTRTGEARSVWQGRFANHVELKPDETVGTLTVRLHPLASTSDQRAIQKRCAQRNETETLFP